MPDSRSWDLQPASSPGRLLGRVVGPGPGPTLICIGGLHGNEPAGVQAIRRVLASLEPRFRIVRGEVIGLVGNIAALEQGRRYLELDLNRIWTAELVDAVRHRAKRQDLRAEEREQLELLTEFESVFDRARGPVYVLDLHTTSCAGPPFATIGDTLRNRAFGRALPIPIILGLEEQIGGTLLEYVNDAGHVTLGVEGGQNESPDSVDNLEAAIWIALVAAALIPRRALPEYATAMHRLKKAARGLPVILEVCYRHPVTADDAFRMIPGYLNFQAIAKGEMVARSRNGEVRSPDGGRILMPLYQELGADGFFVVREVAPIWLTLSSLLRRLRLDRFAPRLLGVRAHPEIPGAVIVEQGRTRWFAVRILHLLGYRREVPTGNGLVMVRRRNDHPLRWRG